MKMKSIFKRGAMATVALSSLFLIGCGGGSSSMGKTIGGIAVSDAATVAEVASRIGVGHQNVKVVWDSLSSSEQSRFVSEYNRLTSGPDFTVSQLNSYLVNNPNYQLDLWTPVAAEASSIAIGAGYTHVSFRDSEALKAVQDSVHVGATNAWRDGWTGSNISISADNNTRHIKQGIRAFAVAPNMTLLRPSDSSAMVKIQDSVSHPGQIRVLFDRDGSAQSGSTFGVEDKVGTAAGIGALVMEKFPTATNAVVNTKAFALDAASALSPQF